MLWLNLVRHHCIHERALPSNNDIITSMRKWRTHTQSQSLLKFTQTNLGQLRGESTLASAHQRSAPPTHLQILIAIDPQFSGRHLHVPRILCGARSRWCSLLSGPWLPMGFLNALMNRLLMPFLLRPLFKINPLAICKQYLKICHKH